MRAAHDGLFNVAVADHTSHGRAKIETSVQHKHARVTERYKDEYGLFSVLSTVLYYLNVLVPSLVYSDAWVMSFPMVTV
ncbi:hypothetical protein LSTR_LSTR003532 [Laodelphax striatellus]|nr:hypothetical protein LSTR_LSTR003532 [Laodelphax striatellus]